jgi:hypothetical protein
LYAFISLTFLSDHHIHECSGKQWRQIQTAQRRL